MNSKNIAPEMFSAMIGELRALRQEVSLLLPQDDLEDYAHPERIEASFRNAINNYPPVSLWT